MKQVLLALFAIAAAVVAALGVGSVVSKIRGLEAALVAEKKHAASLGEQFALQKQTLEHTRKEAEAARTEARSTALTAEQTTAALETAQVERNQARQETEQVAAREAQARQEIADMRQRRQQELDRMQQALSKIAPTRRTASGMVVELANDSFFFDFDKATLRSENRETLSRIAGVLLASEGYRLFIYGHTDDVGPAEYNKELSKQRAQSVAGYLAKSGVPDNLMEVQGFGKSNPRVQNSTAAARQKNRRVEIGIVDSLIDYNVPPKG
jgi:outer membrane protein OmpA-like peptidoglycan-associated protein